MNLFYLWVLWVVLTLAYISNYFYLRYQENDFFSNYLNDLIALPWTFAFISLLYRFIFKINNYQVSLAQIIFTFLSFSIIFEWILPFLFPIRYIGDWIDVFMYFLGSLFWWIFNRFIALTK